MLELTKNNAESLLAQWEARGVGVGNKLVDNMKTKDKAIRIKVTNKVPLDQLSSDKVIPKEIMYKGKVYLTDVIIQKEQIKALDCCATFSTVDTEQRSPVRPLVGGLAIGSMDDTPAFVGTLGQLCIDDRDGTVVGLTNVHVSNADVWYNSNKERYYNTYNKRITQPGLESSVVNQYPLTSPRGTTRQRESFIDTHGVGIVKRYWPVEPAHELNFGFGESRLGYTLPLYKTKGQHLNGEYNKIDAAIFSINDDDTLIDNTTQEGRSQAFSIRGLSNTAIPWATDEQMEEFISLIETSNTTLYVARSGRTTGTVGAGFELGDCPVEVTAYTFFENIAYSPQIAIFTDMIEFKYSAGSCSSTISPIQGGDSGSMLVTDFFNNTPTVVGLCHAGGGDEGFACRIDHVRSILNVRSPTASELSNPLTFTDFSQASFIKASGLPGVIENSGYLEYNGKKYWQIGNAPTQ